MSTTALPPLPARLPRLTAAVRGRAGDPRWVRPALLGVVALAAALCLWHLTASGYSNEYYAAAAKAGSESWKAWFFGALDPGSFITVDKPPLSLWLMGLSARVFGFSSFSILLPQALCTVGAVALLYATVRRSFGPTAGLVAAAALATTPVTVAIARVNNPDALLVLLLVASAYMLQRALESGRTRHLLAVGVLVGLAFMTKMLEGWMVVPALALAYVVAGPPRLLVRAGQLLAAGAAMVVVSIAWPLAVSLWPGSTPYIGGSTDGSIWDLILGYNGLGRITGESAGGGMGGAGFGGAAGLTRLFNDQVGGQVAWLIPLAAMSLAAGLWLRRREPRQDARRAALLLFGAWAVVLAVVFSFAQGTFHPYYVSALAPALAALVGAGAVEMTAWARRSWAGVALLGVALLATAVTATRLLARTPDFAPALRVVIPAAAAVAVVAIAGVRAGAFRPRRALAIGAVAAALAVGAGPAAYSVATVGHGLNGNNVLAGPSSATTGGGMRGMPSGGSGETSTSDLVDYLEAHQGSAKYLVAAVGSQSTAPIIIATGEPVVTIGGFTGSDPAPTVSELSQLVSSGQLEYVLISDGGGFGGGGPGGGSSSSSIATWVKQHGTAVTGVSSSGGTLYKVSVT